MIKEWIRRSWWNFLVCFAVPVGGFLFGFIIFTKVGRRILGCFVDGRIDNIKG